MKTPTGSAIRLSVLLVVVIAIVFLVVQAIQRPVDGRTQAYQAEFGDVFGLQPNADVRLRGVQVGKVTGVSLQPSGDRVVVDFTLQTDHALRHRDQIAIKFQNLTGQRYLALEPGDVTAPPVSSSSLFTNTVDSFDITTVFNGLKPLMNDADPEVYNRLTRNLVAMVEGNDDDLAPVLRDINTLASFAGDRTKVLEVVFDNLQALSDRLRGRSENLENMLGVFHSIFMPVAERMDEFLSLMDKGSIEMSEIVRTLDAVTRLGLGASDATDDITRRIDEAIPDTAAAVESLSLLPGVLESITKLIPAERTSAACSQGQVSLPVTATVLLHGRALTICEATR